MKHERETLEAVIAARNQAVTANAAAAADPGNASAVQQMGAAEGALSSMLGKLFALSEAYPDLKANQNMMQLTEELTSTENRIAFSRQAYNDGAMEYNTALEQFPGSLIANMFPTNRPNCNRRPSLRKSASQSRFRFKGGPEAVREKQRMRVSLSSGPQPRRIASANRRRMSALSAGS